MRLPGFLMKRFVTVATNGEFLEISFRYGSRFKIFSNLRGLYTIKDFLGLPLIWIDNHLVYEFNLYPEDLHIKLNGTFISNPNISRILDINFNDVENIVLIIPNRFNIPEGRHKIRFGARGSGLQFKFHSFIQRKIEAYVFDEPIPMTLIESLQTPQHKPVQKAPPEKLLKQKYLLIISIISLIIVVMYEVVILVTLPFFFETKIRNVLNIQSPFLIFGFLATIIIMLRYCYVKNLNERPTQVLILLTLVYSIIFGFMFAFPSISRGEVALEFFLTIFYYSLSGVMISVWVRYVRQSKIKKNNAFGTISWKRAFICGSVIIPVVIINITFFSISTYVLIMLAYIGYYFLNNYRTIKIKKNNAIVLCIILLLFSLTPIMIDRLYVRNNITYEENYNINSGIPAYLINRAEMFDYKQVHNWTYILSDDFQGKNASIVYPTDRFLYKNRIERTKNTILIPSFQYKEKFQYTVLGDPITSPLIIEYENSSSEVAFEFGPPIHNISSTYFSQDYFKDFCLTFVFLNVSLMPMPNKTIQSFVINNGTLVRIQIQYERWILLSPISWYQESIIIFDENEDLLAVIIVNSYVSEIDVSFCGSFSDDGKY
jgi:hypothetical protein